MKKTLILAGLLAFTMSSAMANEQPPCPPPDAQGRPPMEQGKFQPPPPDHKKMDAKRAEFENKLKLTDEQKAKAKEIRLKGHEEMKPIMDKLQEKRKEAQAIKASKTEPQAQEAQLAKIREEVKVLKKQARDLRIKNMQEFEAILTPKQKKTLEKMKKEGRKNFKKHHPKRPPCPPCPAQPKPCDCEK